MAYTDNNIPALEQRLSRRVSRVLSRSESVAASLPQAVVPVAARIHEILSRLQLAGFHSYLWGGLVRDLLTKRALQTPRDIDVVVEGARNDDIWKLFRDLPGRRNQFGGVHVQHGIGFDMFASSDAWAFAQGLFPPDIQNIPKTPFLNVEAVIIDTEARHGRIRRIISHGFFEALLSQVVDINCEENPYPGLCVLRSLVITNALDFSMSERLARYILSQGSQLSHFQLEEIQLRHYGAMKYGSADFNRILHAIDRQLKAGLQEVILPDSRRSQDEFWMRDAGPSEIRPFL